MGVLQHEQQQPFHSHNPVQMEVALIQKEDDNTGTPSECVDVVFSVVIPNASTFT